MPNPLHRRVPVWPLGHVALLCAPLLVPAQHASAQWTTQTLELQQGLNAVYLLVEPYPQDCDAVFSGLPVESVWLFNQEFSPVQFVEDLNEPEPERPEWLKWYSPATGLSDETTLFAVRAGESYIVKALEDFTMQIKGRPVVRDFEWNPGGYNMTGFHADPGNPPTLSEWFAGSPAHNPLDAWAYENGAWARVEDPAQHTIRPGRPYWIYCNGASDYQGPLRIQLESGYELEYPSFLTEQRFGIVNETGRAKTVTMELLPSEAPPAEVPGIPGRFRYDLAGGADLSLYELTAGGAVYNPLPSALNFAAGGSSREEARLAAERGGLPAADPDSRFQSILVIKDGEGYLRHVGVVVEGHGGTPGASALRLSQNGGEIAPENVGLWVGFVNLNRVSDPLKDGETAVQSEFGFRFMLHVDGEGTARLLKEITHFWRNGTYRPDPENPQLQVVDRPGRYVLVTASAPAALLSDIESGAVIPDSLRDGRPFANRIATPMFSLYDENGNPDEPAMDLSGPFGRAGGRLDVSILLEDSDPLNPFKHQYHPRHGETPPDAPPSRRWDIVRSISLIFSDQPPDGGDKAGWGETSVGGEYTEVLEGLRRDPIVVRGDFELNKVSDVPVLNDGL